MDAYGVNLSEPVPKDYALCIIEEYAYFSQRLCIILLINEMYVHCIMHDLCISFPKNVGKISKEICNKKIRKYVEFRRDKGKRFE